MLNFYTLKNKQQKVALFGTSADPPTKGHKIILEELSEIYDLVISFASNNPSKNHVESLYFRSLLLETLINDFNDAKICFDQELSSPWAINSIRKCKEKYKVYELDFVIGSDLIQEIFLWKNINAIFQEVNFFIIPREGYPINLTKLKSIKKSQGWYKISNLEVPQISSSSIRRNLNYSHLPKSIVPIIKNNNLYDAIKMNK